MAVYALHGLYDVVPFLLALGLAAISAFVLLRAARLFYVPAAAFHGTPLSRNGRLTRVSGVFVGAATVWAAFLVHATLVQYHAHAADNLLAQARALQAQPGRDDAVVKVLTVRSVADLMWVRRYGLLPSAKNEAQLGAACDTLGDQAKAQAHLRRALAIQPGYADARYKYAVLIAADGDLTSAIAELKRVVHDNPAHAEARQDLIRAVRQLGRLQEVVAPLEEVVRRRPYDDGARRDLAAVLAETGRRAGDPGEHE